MKNFFIIIFFGFLLSLGVLALGKTVRYKPWTKPGQEEQYKVLKELVTTPVADLAAESRPRMVIDKTEFQFGTLLPHTKQTCEFEVRNEGNAPLVVRDGGSSCKCTMADLTAVKLAPGESHKIKLTWTTKEAAPVFAQYARILTTDPDNQEFKIWVRGKVVETLGIESPEGLIQILPEEKVTRTLRLFSKTWPSFGIDKVELNRDLIDYHVQPLKIESEGCSQEITLNVSAPIGEVTEHVRVFVKPPADVDLREAMSTFLKEATISDGCFVFDVPLKFKVAKKVNLYGPSIDADGIVNLGNVFLGDGVGRTWNLVGKIRGETSPTAISAVFEGIPELSLSVTPDPDNRRFLLRFTLESSAHPVIYDQFGKHGKLTIETPGLGDQSRLELPVHLTIVEPKK